MTYNQVENCRSNLLTWCDVKRPVGARSFVFSQSNLNKWFLLAPITVLFLDSWYNFVAVLYYWKGLPDEHQHVQQLVILWHNVVCLPV